MAKNRSKRHHYVPQCLQRYFCGPEREIWYAKRTNGEFHAPKRRSTKSCFYEKDLNTTIANGNLSDKVEDAWGKVDNELASMLKNIHEILGRGRLPDLTSDALENLRFIAAMLMTRSPEIAPPVAQIGQRYISELEKFARKNGEQSDECRVNAEDPVRLRQLVNHIRATALGGVPKSVLEELNSFFPTWAIVSDKSGFILGSRMIYATGNDGLKNPDIELWFPISPERVVVFTRDPALSDQVFNVGRPVVRRWNLHIKKESQAIGSHSERLLRSLLNPR